MNVYISSTTKRALDLVISVLALLALSPVYCVIAIAVVIDDGFPILFRQVRVGRGGLPFKILKFRSMRTAVAGSRITAYGDSRITSVGSVLRDTKLDELPQFWNVLRGDMSLIGPRPEDPAFVDAGDPQWALVLSARPGITDFASLVFRDEELLLGPSTNVEWVYRTSILPDKLALNAEYLKRGSLLLDLRLMLLTLCSLFRAKVGGENLKRSLLDH